MFRLIELIFLFVIGPTLLFLDVFPRPWVMYLFIGAIPIILWLRVSQKRPWSDLWAGPHTVNERQELTRIVSRFGMNAVGIVLITFVYAPDKVLSFPASAPFTWLAVMVLYPILMVWPQEVFFRLFFEGRYREILGSPNWVIVVNALVFGWAHMLFGNWFAIVLSGIGGALFMQTYLRTRSMKLVCIEHALYGNLIFTIGLGEYFYSGWAG